MTHPDRVYWAADEKPGRDAGAALSAAHWRRWRDEACARLGASPFAKWLRSADCRWAYRRGFVSVFEGTQQVLLDAWDDLFALGPVEDVRVTNLWHFGTVASLRLFLDRPCVRSLYLRASELRADCVDRLQEAADWLRRLERVELLVERVGNHPFRLDPSAAAELRDWLAREPGLAHVTFAAG